MTGPPEFYDARLSLDLRRRRRRWRRYRYYIGIYLDLDPVLVSRIWSFNPTRWSQKKKLTLARSVGRSNNGRSLVVPPPACLGILVVLRQCFDSIAVYLSSVFCLQSLGSSLRTMFQLPSPFFFFLFFSFFAHIHHLARLSRYFEDSRRLRRAADSCSCPPARLALSYVIIITYY